MSRRSSSPGHGPAGGTSSPTARRSGGSRGSASRSGRLVLRPEAIRQRLLRLEEVISRLEELRAVDARTLGRSFRDAWAIERGLQLGAEILFDVGNHILSAHFGGSATDYEDIIAPPRSHRRLPNSPPGQLK